MGQFVSPSAIKFTVMWLFNECFLSLNGEDWVNRCNKENWRGIPCEWDPCCRDPLSGDRNSLWFCTLVKVNTHPPPPLSHHISQPCYDQPSFTAQNGALFRGQPTRCLLIQGFLFFAFNPVWTFPKGDVRATKRLCLCQKFPKALLTK